MENKEKLKQYLKQSVAPLFEQLIIDILIDTPLNFIDYSIAWLDQKGRKIQGGVKLPRGFVPIKKEIDINIKETPNFDFNPEPQLQPHADNQTKKEIESGSEEDNEEKEELLNEDDFQKLSAKQKQTNMRVSVSAEAYGKYHKKGNYQPKVIPKSDEQRKRIELRLSQAFMFSALDDKEKNIVINAMEEKKFETGSTIIKQGDDGDVLYVVDSGELDCFKTFKKEEGEKYLKTYKPGEAFGELALLYNAPRAATIRAKSESTLFSLDRECFNNIVKESQVKRRERYEKTLEKVDLLSSMDPYERTHLCDGIKEVKHKAGEFIIKEGELGDKFYMVDEGQLVATKTMKQGEQPIEVLKYKEGDYFGELSLVRNIPRQANVQAITDVVLVYLDAPAFKRLMGPMEDLLKRNEDKYSKYWRADDVLQQMENNQLHNQK